MRLVIISNRLPTIVTWEHKQLRLQETAGGLVTGLGSWLDHPRDEPYVWIGWPGSTVPGPQQDKVRELLAEQHKAVPVFLSQAAMDRFYLGFCNRTLWPLFHYFPSYVQYDTASWQTYREVQQSFARAAREVLQPGDVVWIHDYHLMLLPAMLRQDFPDLSIGFFLHIPFPSFEIFRLLPSKWRRELLEGLLGADLIGFHTHDYTTHFVTCVRRMLGLDSHLGTILLRGRLARADTFPMGIDYKLYHELPRRPAVEEEQQRLAVSLNGLKTIVSVDRLDYSKGIPNRLLAYLRFLERYAEWHGKVCLAMVVVPSRIGVEHYQAMKREIDELVGSINGRFGTVDWTPIRYQYRMLSAEPLAALYAASDIGLVTPLRDGMNLVAKEFIAARQDGSGVLILSEMAGAARELGEALVVNPNHADEIADAIRVALEMPLPEQIQRNRAMQARIEKYDVVWWADDFLRTLREVTHEQARLSHVTLNQDALLEAFHKAKQRLILLDYDGTLVPFYPHPDQAVPDPALVATLQWIAALPHTRLAIVSGRSRPSLQRWFENMPVEIAAEHGAWERDAQGGWTSPLPNSTWKDELRPFMESAAGRLAGSFVEEKDFALVWHYRMADPELGRRRAGEVLDQLSTMVANMDVQVLRGNKVVEVRNASVNKGNVARRMLATAAYDFVMVAGDDWTDEDMFRVLPPDAWSIKVGTTASLARFSVSSQSALRALLVKLSAGESSR